VRGLLRTLGGARENSHLGQPLRLQPLGHLLGLLLATRSEFAFVVSDSACSLCRFRVPPQDQV